MSDETSPTKRAALRLRIKLSELKSFPLSIPILDGSPRFDMTTQVYFVLPFHLPRTFLSFMNPQIGLGI